VLGRGGSAAAAALGTTNALAYGLGFLIFGPLSDRYGRKPILVPGMAALAIVTAGLAAAPSLPVLALLRTVQGLVAASFSAAALAYIGESVSTPLAINWDWRNRYQAWHSGASSPS
jgi:YNFM family putative membrane transporter